jgi:nickel-type superoxide dismutase maturation protease
VGSCRGRHYLFAVTALAAAWVWRRIDRVAVGGDSMRPSLEPGDRLVVLRTSRPRPRQVVALVDPRQPGRLVVKRVAALTDAGVTVVGDNPAASTDSRHYGPVPATAVRGRAVWRYWPESRRGRL